MNGKLIAAAAVMLPAMAMTSNAQDTHAYIGYELLNIRQEASMSSSVVVVLKKYDKVDVLRTANGWTQVKTKTGLKGWTPSQGLTNKDFEVKSDYTNANIKTGSKTKIVNNDFLNVRQGPGTNYKVIGQLNRNDKVQILEEGVGWTKILYDDSTEAYVSSKYLSTEQSQSAYSNDESSDAQLVSYNTTTESADNGDIMFVTSPILNLRQGQSISSKKLYQLKKDDAVSVLSNDKDWVKVKFKNYVGYVPAFYLGANTQDPTASSNVTGKDRAVNMDTKSSANISNTNPGTTTYEDTGITVDDMIALQSSVRNISQFSFVNGVLTPINGAARNSTVDELKYYIDPGNFMATPNGALQFAKLDEYKDCITADQLNQYLNKYCKTGNVFHNKGQAFIDAAKKHNINVYYLVAHSMIETGYGTSKLAKGQVVNGVKVYNFFGIGAFDGAATLKGAQAAYKNGWTSVDATIDGSAAWIAKGYIHNNKYKQNTLYKMKYCQGYTYHQYATSVEWPVMIANAMANVAGYSSNGVDMLNYLVPNYVG